MNKAIFLDRDGTINVDKEYLYKISEFEFLPGVFEALKMLQKEDYLLFIISNQSGIARGYYSEQEYLFLNNWVIERLAQNDVIITDNYFCPHHPDSIIPKYKKICRCRKPGTELFERAIKKYDIDVSQSYAIGDRLRDCSICSYTECHGYLIGRKESEETIGNVIAGQIKNVEYRQDLLDCARSIILKDTYVKKNNT